MYLFLGHHLLELHCNSLNGCIQCCCVPSPFTSLFTLYCLCPVHFSASQRMRATGQAPLPCVGIIVFLYKLSSCITRARTQCLHCSHHYGYWDSTKLVANSASILHYWFQPFSWAAAEIASGITRRSETFSWVCLLYWDSIFFFSREVKLEWRRKEEEDDEFGWMIRSW